MTDKERKDLLAFAQYWRLLFGGVSPARWAVVNKYNVPLTIDPEYGKAIQANKPHILQQK